VELIPAYRQAGVRIWNSPVRILYKRLTCLPQAGALIPKADALIPKAYLPTVKQVSVYTDKQGI